MRLARLDTAQAEESSLELGDFIEPGSSPDLAGTATSGATGAATGLDQLKDLQTAGLIDADTFKLIEATYASAPAIDAGEFELLQHGESATATVLTTPEPLDQGGTRLGMTLEVHPAAGSPYPVDCTVASLHPGGNLKVGDFLRVKVDPQNPERVAIDWTGFGT